MTRIPIALQLYSVRDDAAENLPKTLEAVATMGYEGVEFAGFYDRSSQEIKDLLDEFGLRVAGSHTALHLLQGDELQRTIEFNQVIGNRYLIVPSLPKSMWSSRQACLKTAETLNEIAESLRPYGMYTGFHNHKDEVQPFTDEEGTPFTTLFDSTGDDVVVQLDVGHALRGGADPVALIRRYPGRAKTVHVKEYDPEDETTVVGEGVVPWPDVFQACESSGGTEWYIVEHERYSNPPLECVRQCLHNLKAIAM